MPSADQYPIEPDAEGTEAKWSSEETRDGWTRVTNPDDGATLGVTDTARIIQVDGLAFRDMDGDGKLSLFEDWRQTPEDRAADLAAKLSDQECIQLMWHGGASDAGGGSVEETTANTNLIDLGSAAGVSRFNADEESYASSIAWINGVQATCETRPWGIPYINSTDPYPVLGIPGTIGISAAMDKDLWRRAGMWVGRAFRATGVRLELGPQVDLYTNPKCSRLRGAETEDPALGRDFTQAFAGGMQSTWGDDEATEDLGWGKDSVGNTLKHFVAAGAMQGGADDHSSAGMYNIFPGDNYKAHLIPFLDGGLHLDSKTETVSAVMPNYGIAYSADAEYGLRVGGGFNKKQLSILRNAGFDGVICSDWNILKTDFTRGVEGLTEAERYRLLVDAGCDQYGGGYEPVEIGEPVFESMVSDMGQDAASERVHESALHVLTLMAHVQLFDQPYSDRSEAKELFESQAAADFAREANEKSVVMLKNAGGVIAQGAGANKPTVYVPQIFTAMNKSPRETTPASVAPCMDLDVLGQYFNVVTDEVGDPTGEPVEGQTDPQYQESDIVRRTDFTDVKYALIRIKSPQDANSGAKAEGDTTTYVPISLQYRPYTADGPNVTQVSIAGDPLDGLTWYDHGMETDVPIENRSYYGQSTTVKNESDLDLVLSVREALPEEIKLVVIIDAYQPMVFSELEPAADVILMNWVGSSDSQTKTFAVTDETFARILAGEVEPTGLLTFQMPKSMDAVEAGQEDVPRDMDCYTDSEGNTYDFCFGLNWSGVIDDERVATYKVSPISEPETEVKASE